MQARPDRALVSAILSSATRDAQLQRTLEELDAAGETATQARVFEAVAWRFEPQEYWIWFRMCRVYAELERWDASHLCACRAVQIHPAWDPSAAMYRMMFDYFRRGADFAAAADVLQQQRRHLPALELFEPHEIAEVFHEISGLSGDNRLDTDEATPLAEAAAGLALTLRRVQAVMRAVFAAPDLDVEFSTTSDSVAGWDQIGHPILILALEQAFHVTLPPAEVVDADSVGALVNAIERALAALRRGRPKLIVYGDSQAATLAAIFRSTAAIGGSFEVVYHDSDAAGAWLAHDLRDFETAELLMLQDAHQWREHPFRDILPDQVRVVAFPVYYVAALWPSDAMLTSGLGSGRDDSRAAGVLCPTNIAEPEADFSLEDARSAVSAPDLRRYAALEEARLLAEDDEYCLTTGRYIVEHYRRERLFHTLMQPSARLFRHLAADLLARTGISPDGELSLSPDRRAATVNAPVDPAAIAELGLLWADRDAS